MNKKEKTEKKKVDESKASSMCVCGKWMRENCDVAYQGTLAPEQGCLYACK